MTPAEADYRTALQLAERALMHAAKWMPQITGVSKQAEVTALINEALAEVSRVLDIGRDESNEMVLT